MKVLVTGTTSGLGKFLAEKYNADTFNRGDEIPKKEYDIIFHCAYDHGEPFRNMILTRALTKIPHKLFVLMSTVDIYEKNNEYSETKLRCEEVVKNTNHIILRLGALIGKYMRPNNLMRMFNNEQLTLTKESTFGFITYDMVADKIDELIKCGQTGTFDVMGEIMCLEQIAEDFGLSPHYGNFTYTTSIHIKPIGKANLNEIHSINSL